MLRAGTDSEVSSGLCQVKTINKDGDSTSLGILFWCSSVSEKYFLTLRISRVSGWAHCLLSCCWAPKRRAWLWLHCSLNGVFIHMGKILLSRLFSMLSSPSLLRLFLHARCFHAIRKVVSYDISIEYLHKWRLANEKGSVSQTIFQQCQNLF